MPVHGTVYEPFETYLQTHAHETDKYGVPCILHRITSKIQTKSVLTTPQLFDRLSDGASSIANVFTKMKNNENAINFSQDRAKALISLLLIMVVVSGRMPMLSSFDIHIGKQMLKFSGKN